MADTPQPVEPQDFAAFLLKHNRGRSHRELSEQLQKLVEAIVDTGKGGSITFVLSIKPESKTEGVLLITDEIKVKTPQYDRPASIFFADANYHLVRDDPNQMSFEQHFAEEKQ